MGWKWELSRARARREQETPEPRTRQQIQGDLEAMGLSQESVEALSERVVEHCADLGEDEYRHVLDGVLVTARSLSDAQEALSRSYTELREMERLMAAFSGELSKVDEILEVLAAYARRMREASTAATVPRILH